MTVARLIGLLIGTSRDLYCWGLKSIREPETAWFEGRNVQ